MLHLFLQMEDNKQSLVLPVCMKLKAKYYATVWSCNIVPIKTSKLIQYRKRHDEVKLQMYP